MPVVERSADLETGDLTEFDNTQVSGTGSTLTNSAAQAFEGTRSLRAFITAADGFARARWHPDWRQGDEVWWSFAVFLPVGFYAAAQVQIDLRRWDNFTQDGTTTERGGVVIHSPSDPTRVLRLVRMKEGVGGEQVTLINSGIKLTEGEWHHVEARQRFHATDGQAINDLWIDDELVGSSTTKNTYRADIVIDRDRFGVVASGSTQTNDLEVFLDRLRISTERTGSGIAVDHNNVMAGRADELPPLGGQLIH